MFRERRIRKFVRRVDETPKPNKYAYVMSEFKHGKLYASAGYKVKNPAQARAIAYHMAYGKTSKHRKGTTKQSKNNFLLRLKKNIVKRFGYGDTGK